MPYPIHPSLLAFDFACLIPQVAAVETAGATALHLDVMDGHFVPNLTFGAMVAEALRPHTRLPFAAHLMVYQPESLIEPMARAGVGCLFLHPESTTHIHRALERVRGAGLEVGVALNPGSPLLVLEPLIEMVDAVLVMSVNPGFGGQAFIPAAIKRVAALREMAAAHGVAPEILCDGGVDLETIGPLAAAGMTGAVVGTALFQEGDPGTMLRRLQAAVR